MQKLLASLLFLSTLVYGEVVTEYFKNGAIKSQTHYIDGTRTATKPGIKQGEEKVYYIEGSLAYKVNYVNGKRDGKMTWWDKQGNLLKVIHYDHGKLEGWEITYFPNGKIKAKQLYKNDKREGLYKEFYDNGRLALVVPYKHGKKEGMQKEYAYEGYLSSDVLYKNNYKEGKQRWYDKNGKVIKEEEFVHDVPVNIMKQIEKQKPSEADLRLQGLNFSPNRPHD